MDACELELTAPISVFVGRVNHEHLGNALAGVLGGDARQHTGPRYPDEARRIPDTSTYQRVTLCADEHAVIHTPEMDLHPEQQRIYMRELAAAAKALGIRYAMATHSPFIVDSVPPECVFVVTDDHAQTLSFHRLTDHPNWSQVCHYGADHSSFWLSQGETGWPTDEESAE